MYLRCIPAGVAALLLSAFASSASAALVTAAFTGHVAHGIDSQNLFLGGDLTGDAVTTTYAFDTSVGVDDPSYAPGEGRRGSGFLAVTVNINGTARAFTFDQAEVAYDPFGFDEVYYRTSSSDGFAFISDAFGYGGFHTFTDFGSVAGQGQGQFILGFGEDRDSLSFSLDRVTLSGPDGIPEPATWGMMVLGFGAAGVLLRRRRPVTA
jgi:hypothetical protein